MVTNLLHCGRFQLDLTYPRVMGIVNVTPDSFSDGGQYAATDLAVAHAQQLIAEGADILDIGGESTRPGAEPVSLQEELRRVIPVIEALSKISTVPLSIDTYKPQVMQAAIQAGVDIVNDIRALQEEHALEIVANSNVGVCLMHMQGVPQTMQINPTYADVLSEVQQFLADRAVACLAHGINKNRIMLDPGFGFGKTKEHNIALIQHLDRLTQLGYPLLVGLSRKSVLGKIAGGDELQRLHAGLAASVISVMKGAKVVRVHDVKATVDALKVVAAVI
ncbi:MAG: dihydropteroate synthase [Methylotenera sp. 24-45-7]|nr:MAG: dihydropteroate synthase [Mehylophilales bacterium 35-46-6]OYY84021.1 MAG: dihydropteroate synthase [Methylophilales bacterium 16-45-9]OYZ41332.1 MAG: dihydropteroate synthase [Methylotenera sp. 24-45-7]OZA08615.1 MAG: dihydropteroate synthase [Methylotenera sp. 17-45-7]OZA54436.1 MAG: dihydropteroate synthase [Methylophilales bacterium 39-45-7]HQS37006.1 dihydropteroate synthase [Methylotenera sp.]